MQPTHFGPDRSTFRHWLDRVNRPVQGAAQSIRETRRRFGAPCGINREPGRTHYVWQSGFDRFSFTVFSRR